MKHIQCQETDQTESLSVIKKSTLGSKKEIRRKFKLRVQNRSSGEMLPQQIHMEEESNLLFTFF